MHGVTGLVDANVIVAISPGDTLARSFGSLEFHGAAGVPWTCGNVVLALR